MKNLGANFEHWKTCEWAIPSILAYSEIHHNELPKYGIDFNDLLTKEEVIEYLHNKGISSNYNEPMELSQIKRMNEEKLRQVYDSIQWNNNLVNIQQVHGKDLEIVNKDEYDYILTYSFPCQDLSLAGKGKGMSRDGGTRSGMLWEVERILDECNELGTLPQILLMENVPQVIGEKNIKDFQSWREKLESLGYSNYIEVLNAKHYGIPQNRERAFMISILGEYNYTFPKRIPLDKKLKDMLEKNVDEKYYLSDKQINQVIHWNAQQEPLETLGKPISPTLTTRSGAYAAGMVLTSNLEQDEEKEIGQELLKIKEATKKGYKEAYEGDGIDISGRMETHRGTVQKGMCQTLKTSIDVGVVVKDEQPLKKELCNKLIENGDVEEGDVIKHSYTQQILDGKKKCVEKSDGVMITLTTRGDCVGVCVKDEEEYVGMYNYVKSDNFMQGRDRFQPNKEISSTILAGSPPEAVVTRDYDEPKVLGGIGEKKSNGGTQWYQQDRIYDDNVAISVTTSFNPYYAIKKDQIIEMNKNAKHQQDLVQSSEGISRCLCTGTHGSAPHLTKTAINENSCLRIRKLTGKECYRLMGFSDEDCDNARKVLSEAMIYHTAGDSIVVPVIEQILKQLL